MTEAEPVLVVEEVSHAYGRHRALDGVRLSVAPGERVGILGPSGAGKSTLLSLLNGSLTPTSGRVRAFGQDLAELRGAARRELQRRVGAVPQDLALIEYVRVLHNVQAGRLGRMGTAQALASLVWPRSLDDVRNALDQVGLGWAMHERTERLSGGERQRVAIARLLLQQPELVLADEPAASLDPELARLTLDLLGDAGRTVVVSLHQPELAKAHCTRIVGIRSGQVVFDRVTAELAQRELDALYQPG